MAYHFPEGAKFLFSPLSTFAVAKNIASISNADPAVCNLVGHGYADNAEVLIRTGWEDADAAIYRVDALSADTFALQDLDTDDEERFSPGGHGASTAQLVGPWLEIPQVLTISFSGGDERATEINPLSRMKGLRFVTGFNPTGIQLGIGHDPQNATFKQMRKLSRSFKKVAFKLQLRSGAVSLGFGSMAVNPAPQMNSQQVNTITVAFNLDGELNSY